VTRVCIAGATGWTGRALVSGVLAAPDLELVCAVARSAAGRDLGEALGEETLGVPVHASVAEALEGVDVNERLTIRHDAGGTPEPYVAGTLIAVRKAPSLIGVTRGLDTLLVGDGEL
jgi:uncharacterized NAD-dependent epimerase/dehydratase family protein